MAANRDVARAAEAKYRARRQAANAAERARKALGDYDWVVVLRAFHGHTVTRELTSPEKLELVRLILRKGGQVKDHAQRMGWEVIQLEHLVWHYGPKAKAIGLDQPMRFCFLPEEQLAHT